MIGFDWFSRPEVKNVLSFIYTIVDVIRIIVPLGLIVMTTLDIAKKIIDPNDKDGQKKIMYRAIAAIIVFLIPTIINIVFKFMDIDINSVDITNKPTIEVTPKPTIAPTPVITATPIPTPIVKPRLSNISVTCPPKDKYYKIGDVVELKTDIPTSFNDKIEWIEDTGAVKINPIADNRNVKVEILDQPKLSAVWVTVVAGGTAKSCQINISALDKLEITNCPANNKIYHVDDSFILESNLPSYYKSNYAWGGEIDSKIAKVTPIDNGRRAKVEIVGVPDNKYIYIAVAADSPVKSDTCKINIE